MRHYKLFKIEFHEGGSNGTCSLKSTEPPFIEDFESKVFFDSQSVCGYLQVIWNDSNIRPGHKGTHWATHCILSKGIDLEKDQPSKADECGPRCQFNSKCTHFTWLPTNQINVRILLAIYGLNLLKICLRTVLHVVQEGRCFLKTDGASKEDAKFYAHAVCGIVERKPSISTTTPSSSEDCTCTCEA